MISELNEKYRNLVLQSKLKLDENKENNNEKTDNIQGDKDKCTKEELEYIQKLANEHKGDFILSK